jgi:adenine-specific DNA-methyltransferase
MTDSPERVSIETQPPSQAVLEALQELIPGAVSDGVIDAQRIGEAAGLPVAGIKDGAERFGLMWAGRGKAVEALQAPSMAALAPDMENSINWDTAENVFIEGDNLEVLKLLQKAYNDQVKLIYIDPPYNTGNDFVYNDDFSQPIKHYLEVTGQVDGEGNRLVANTEVSGRKHSNWLSMMYPRLVLARNLLTEDGLLAVSIDENEVHNLVPMLDEIYGSECRVAVISVVNNLKGRSDAQYIANAHEYLVLYMRSNFKTLGLPLPQVIQDTYKLVDENLGAYRLLPLRKSGTNSLRQDRPNMFYPLYVNPSDGTVSVQPLENTVEVLPLFPDGKEGRWRWGAETAKNQANLLLGRKNKTGKFDIQVKDFLGDGDDQRRAKPKSIWLDPKFTSDLGTYQLKELLGDGIFDHPKPLGLLEELMEFVIEPGDLVMDFFSGSGTTGHATYLKNLLLSEEPARFVMVNLPEILDPSSPAYAAGFRTISDIARKRLKKVMEMEPTANNQGLRCVRLGGSSFRNSISQDTGELLLVSESLLPLMDNASVALEVLLKNGVRLDQPWARIQIAGEPAVVSDGVCVVLARELNDDIVEAAKELKEAHTVIFLEDAFAGRDSVKANAVLGFKQVNKTMKTI